MTRVLRPWAYGPFEVLLHAEMHYRSADDLDRRISMIGFDNAIEVAITTYLTLNPIQRDNRTYKKVDVEKWLFNFHSKLDFFFEECHARGVTPHSQQDELVWFHDLRNDQYHGGSATVPQKRALDGVRSAAIEVFSVLFDEEDIEALLAESIAAMGPPPKPPRTEGDDKVIDNEFGLVEVGGQPEYTSALLYAIDPNRYKGVARDLRALLSEQDDEEGAS